MEPYGSTAVTTLNNRRKKQKLFHGFLTTPSATQFTVSSGVAIEKNKPQVMRMEAVVV
jgi:hypothetical protein